MYRRSLWMGGWAACLLGCAATGAESSRPSSPDPRAPVWTSLQDMHASYVEAFVQSDGFGIRRVTPMMMLMQGGTLALGQQRLRVEDVRMIGMARHDPPLVYASGVFKFQHADGGQVFLPMPGSRPVNDEERLILGRLQGGEELVSVPGIGRPLSVGAIRARENCLACHRSKKAGDVLGAFVYALVPAQEK